MPGARTWHQNASAERPSSLLEHTQTRATPGGRYTGPAGDEAKPGSRTARRPVRHHGTSVRALDMKDIVLVTNHKFSEIVANVVRSSKRIAIVPYEQKLIPQICTRCVWVALSPNCTSDVAYNTFIQAVIREKIKDAGTDSAVQRLLTPKVVLVDGARRENLPAHLKAYQPFDCSHLGGEQIAEFIEGRSDEILNHVEKAIRETEEGPFLRLAIELKLLEPTSRSYLKRAKEALKESLEDASSYPRQLLTQLYSLVNVVVLGDNNDVPVNQTCAISLELRPIDSKSCLTFCRACAEGEFAESIRSHVKVNNEVFVGEINSNVKPQNLLHVLEYLLDTSLTESHDKFVKLIENGQFQELARNVRGVSVPRSHTIPKLKDIAKTFIYEQYLRNSSHSPYGFLKCMRQVDPILNPIEGIRSHGGFNALHLAVKEEREDFLKMLLYSNQWGLLRRDIIRPVNPSSHAHKGYTPHRLAEGLSYKSRGYEVFGEFEKWDEIWRRLHPFMKACLAGSLDQVSTLVESRSELLHLKDSTGSNCLFYACASANTQLVRFLLANHVPQNVQNKHGESALHIAAMFGHTVVLEVLAEVNFDIRGQRNKSGHTAIDYSAMNGDLEVLKLYTQKHFTIDATALSQAAKFKQTNVVEYLIDICKVREGADEDGRLALHYEIMNGHFHTVDRLLAQGADITHTDRFRKNVFHLAAEFCRKDIMELLLKQNVSKEQLRDLVNGKDSFMGKDLLYVVRGKDRGRKAWHWVEIKRLYVKAFKHALHSGQIDVASYGRILKSGFGPGPDDQTQRMVRNRVRDFLAANKGQGKPDMTPLHVAVLRNCESIVRLLLKNGADPNALDYTRATPLHYAAMSGNVEILGLLEQYGADVRIKAPGEGGGRSPGQVAEINRNMLAANFIRARPTIQRAQVFVSDVVGRITRELSESKLEKARARGENVKRVVIDALRGLTIDVNQVLFDLGSGPILEESETTTGGDYRPTV